MGRFPKPDAERRNRSERVLEWNVLPAVGRSGPAPHLPTWRPWTEATLRWWADLWSSPQAIKWDPTGRTLHRLAVLHHQLMLDVALSIEQSKVTSISSEMRQIEARHGLTPKAMLDLRWRVGDAASDAVAGADGNVVQLFPAPPPDAASMPGKRDPKSAWVDWAVLCGVERAAAASLSKPKLIAELSSLAAPAAAAAPVVERPVSRAVQRLRAAQATKQPPVRKATKKPPAKKTASKGRGRKR